MTSDPKHTGDLRFSDLNLDKRLLDAITKIGFEYCTPIQAETLPWTLACEDLIGQAQTGTGKTAAFLITAIQSLLETPIDEKERFASEPRVLALAPTRELAPSHFDFNLTISFVCFFKLNILPRYTHTACSHTSKFFKIKIWYTTNHM